MSRRSIIKRAKIRRIHDARRRNRIKALISAIRYVDACMLSFMDRSMLAFIKSGWGASGGQSITQDRLLCRGPESWRQGEG
jgi:hypothetical protein